MSDLLRAVERIAAARRGVAFTGAGISAESGISTYRDPGGLWDRYGNQGMLAVLADRPDQAPQILGEFFTRLEAARPNPAHAALARLEQMGHIRAVITQNVDNLHREAGSATVYELHGNLYRLRCMACGRKRPVERAAFFDMMRGVLLQVKEFSLAGFARHLPRCECGGLTRSDFVSFGEAVQDLPQATAAARECDLMLIVGTSGVVYPAAALPGMAKSAGASLIEINARESELTPACDLSIRAPAGEVLPQILEGLEQRLGAE